MIFHKYFLNGLHICCLLNCNVTEVNNLEIYRFFLPITMKCQEYAWNVCYGSFYDWEQFWTGNSHLYPKSIEFFSGEERQNGQGGRGGEQRGKMRERVTGTCQGPWNHLGSFLCSNDNWNIKIVCKMDFIILYDYSEYKQWKHSVILILMAFLVLDEMQKF